MQLRSTSRARSALLNVTMAIHSTDMPWADGSTIWDFRRVATGPLFRRRLL
ncbi:hypothetical protein [Blastococcus brunescens]|uniref:Uncharacterized protein n=1 Tax=Blastococcus brunescens TaxID=1564165 RepID=A0ABZ1AZL3_9ACTN|nr:hypothetical protein [Blastococcus sp. BMG 8361]WRL63366.1 hypothetical protein U6N30_27060 [Blastococcus sp. BMG 8361]